ncbi:Mitogen-activated protein kinase kinase kinase 7 [Blastocladiella emersonii ATCC 22665]|nr:Mitogen-activated protein kinase kinase kinase 7 [Blastocladiella emersonii ATCC 22665]
MSDPATPTATTTAPAADSTAAPSPTSSPGGAPNDPLLSTILLLAASVILLFVIIAIYFIVRSGAAARTRGRARPHPLPTPTGPHSAAGSSRRSLQHSTSRHSVQQPQALPTSKEHDRGDDPIGSSALLAAWSTDFGESNGSSNGGGANLSRSSRTYAGSPGRKVPILESKEDRLIQDIRKDGISAASLPRLPSGAHAVSVSDPVSVPHQGDGGNGGTADGVDDDEADPNGNTLGEQPLRTALVLTIPRSPTFEAKGVNGETVDLQHDGDDDNAPHDEITVVIGNLFPSTASLSPAPRRASAIASANLLPSNGSLSGSRRGGFDASSPDHAHMRNIPGTTTTTSPSAAPVTSASAAMQGWQDSLRGVRTDSWAAPSPSPQQRNFGNSPSVPRRLPHSASASAAMVGDHLAAPPRSGPADRRGNNGMQRSPSTGSTILESSHGSLRPLVPLNKSAPSPTKSLSRAATSGSMPRTDSGPRPRTTSNPAAERGARQRTSSNPPVIAEPPPPSGGDASIRRPPRDVVSLVRQSSQTVIRQTAAAASAVAESQSGLMSRTGSALLVPSASASLGVGGAGGTNGTGSRSTYLEVGGGSDAQRLGIGRSAPMLAPLAVLGVGFENAGSSLSVAVPHTTTISAAGSMSPLPGAGSELSFAVPTTNTADQVQRWLDARLPPASLPSPPAPPAWDSPHALIVDYARSLGEDGCRSVHLARYNEARVLVHWYTPPGVADVATTAAAEHGGAEAAAAAANANANVQLWPRMQRLLNRRLSASEPVPVKVSDARRESDVGEVEGVEAWTAEEVLTIWAEEVYMMRALQSNHENILPLTTAVAWASSDPHSSSVLAWSVMASGKPLVEIIFNLTIDWYDDDAARVLADTASALAFAAHHGLAHGALTLLDIWLLHVPQQDPTAFPFRTLVGGFGLGAFAGAPERRAALLAAAPVPDALRAAVVARYLDPLRLLDGGESDPAASETPTALRSDWPRVTSATRARADVYAMGILAYECVERIPAFLELGADPAAVRRAVAAGTRPSLDLRKSMANAAVRGLDERTPAKRRIRAKLVELLTRCWAADPARRPGMDEVAGEMAALVPRR